MLRKAFKAQSPWLVLTLVCVLASACSKSTTPADTGGDKPEKTTPAAQNAAPLAENPASDGKSPAPATSEPRRSEAPTPGPAATPPSRLAPSAPSSAAAAPTAPRVPEFREVTIPAGRTISIRLSTPVASDTSHVEDRVEGTLTRPIVVSGTTVVPAGAEVSGTVLDASRSGRVKGRASVTFRFERLLVGGDTHGIRTARITRQAKPSTGDDLKKGGIGAGVGAVVGGIIGGGKGAAIGAGAGGTGAVLATRGKEIRLPSGTTVRTTLQEPLTLSVPVER